MENEISMNNAIDIAYKKNLLNPPIEVCHSDLINADNESIFRKRCPKCKVGILLVQRDSQTLVLSNTDRCIVCGQEFIYTDISILRTQDPISNK